jgi:Rrf2 family transcriptional regulator, iron-sulfur cluster assembly transcription factor
MLLTKRNEYALQVMIMLAQPGEDGQLPASLMAAHLRTTQAFMSKICQRLVRARLVRARRGRGGGLVLAKPALAIKVRDVFAAVDGAPVVSECMVRGRCDHLLCPLFPVLKRMQGELNRGLNNTTLASLASRTK